MKAKLWSKLSFVQKNILQEKNILKARIGLNVGCGKKIFIYKYNWIPRSKLFKLTSLPTLLEYAHVKKLINANNEWNIELFKDILVKKMLKLLDKFHFLRQFKKTNIYSIMIKKGNSW